ncbi:MAG: bifunctional UDP-N-acetylglucosamine diphosphorylase/glucosamine-1-phosphate N-acetyltransferase GlmU [Bryobacteraceae bacterium]
MNTTVVILAAGLGTRMRSKQAKVLHRAGGRALVQHVVRSARAVADPDRIIVVTGHQADAVEQTLAPTGVSYVRQTEQKGTGHALAQCADKASKLDGLLMVLVGDAPLLTSETLVRLRDQQASSGTAGTLISTSVPDPTGYGRVITDAQGDVLEIVEHKSCTPDQLKIDVINSGIYCLQADLVWKNLSAIQPNAKTGEYYLTDIFEILRKQGHRLGAMHLADPSELLGINTRIELAEADAILRARKRRALMLSGVTIEQPESVTIDMDVEVGQDTILEPNVRLLGETKIGEDCRIGAGSILDTMTVESGATIHPYTNATQSFIATGAQVGPFARLRPNTRVEAGAEVGNFAELKNTRLGPGAKSHHVSYLGDADIGAKTNIGAGTVICNYDGTKKHRTNIGEAVFIGSNSTLVAPVEIGKDSYVAAGSVITDEVPTDALALGRARQTVKPDWAAKRRAAQKK